MAITALITHYQRHYGVAAPLPHLLPICSTKQFQNDLARSVKILIAALRAFYLFWTLFLIKFLDSYVYLTAVLSVFQDCLLVLALINYTVSCVRRLIRNERFFFAILDDS